MQKILLVFLLCFTTFSFAQDRQADVGGKGGNGRNIEKIFDYRYEFSPQDCRDLRQIYGTRKQLNVCKRLEDLILRERATYDQSLFFDDCCLEIK